MTEKKLNPALTKKLQPSAELSQVVGSEPISRADMTKKLWDYIKANNLQDPKNKRQINADGKLEAVFGKSKADMFEMTKLVSKHLS